MNKKMPLLMLLSCSLLIIGCLQAQHSVKSMQSDFDLLSNAMKESYGGLYRYTSKNETDKIFTDFRNRLNRPMTQLEFIGVITEFLATMHDGHLRLDYDEATTARLAKAKMFPLRLLMEQGILKVILNDSPADASILPGMELVSINDRDVNQIVKSLMLKITSDGFNQTGKRRRVANNFGQLYYLFIDTASKFRVQVKDGNGKIITAMLDGVMGSEREKNSSANPVNAKMKESIATFQDRNGKANVSLQMLEGAIASVRIRGFGGNSYYAEIDSVFKVVNEARVKALILDLRGNGGGVDQYGAYLVAQFMDKPFRYFERIHLPTIHPSFATWPPSTFEDVKNGTTVDPNGGYLATAKLHPGLGEQPPGKYPFKGKLIVLTDGGTFSTAADASALIRHLTTAVFIGDETGGGYEGNTSGLNTMLKLPDSGLSIRIHQYDYYNAVKPAKEKGRGIIPDYEVSIKIEDVLKGLDRALEKAKEMEKK